MIMLGLRFMGDVPFREVYIHGLVRDADGQKMSKSKGNVLDPLDIIDGIELDALVAKRTSGLMQPQRAPAIARATRAHYPTGIAAHGSDALRFTFASLATTGRDIVFDRGRVDGYRNFCNKLWNAARYVLMNTQDFDTGLEGGAIELALPERWIISRLQRAEQGVIDGIRGYRMDLAAQALYAFVWDEYCDWYLELSKATLQHSADPAQIRGTRRTLVRVLEAVLRLAHPFMPFITEEIWQRVAPLAGRAGKSIMLEPYPEPVIERIDESAEFELAWLQSFVMAVRRIRGEMDMPPGRTIPLLLRHASAADRDRLTHNRAFLDVLTRLESITYLTPEDVAPESAIALVGELEVLVPMAGLVDKAAELTRLDKERQRLGRDLERSERKLANENFLTKAPQPVVQKERAKLAELRSALDRLDRQYERVQAI
ncbi:MAG: class I tRNA ligase family protein, partial [Nitrococcus sp.]|nr:class I tRNA ligase family protein [Nitrococcus sp.]